MPDTKSQSVLRETLYLQPSIEAAIILGSEGELVALEAAEGIESELSPLLTLLTSICERATRELGRGGFSSLFVEGTQGHVVVVDLGSERVLGLVASMTSMPGLLLDDAH
ncbi:MAG: hypothetical protein AAFU79_36900, partial [Myxococcota bacterium]